MLRLAVRNIFRHTARTSLTLAAIVFGVTGLILGGGFVEDVFVQLREATIHSQLGHLQVYRAGYSTVGRTNPYRYMMEDGDTTSAALKSIPHVTDVLQRVQFSGLLSTNRTDLPIIGEGVEPDKEARLGTSVTISAGRRLTADDEFGMLVGLGVANSLALEPGDYVTLLISTPDGALNTIEAEIVGVFRTFSKDYDDRAVRIPLAAAQELLLTSGVHILVVSLDDTESTDRVARNVREILSKERFEVRTWYELADFYRQTVTLYKQQFGVVQLILLIMVLLSVANSVNMAIFERIGEFGTLKALGNRGRDVFRLVMLENIILGGFGAALGIVFGVALAWVISKIGIPMPPPPNSNSPYTAFIRIVPSVIVVASIVGIAATSLAAILPARRAARFPVAEALRRNV